MLVGGLVVMELSDLPQTTALENSIIISESSEIVYTSLGEGQISWSSIADFQVQSGSVIVIPVFNRGVYTITTPSTNGQTFQLTSAEESVSAQSTADWEEKIPFNLAASFSRLLGIAALSFLAGVVMGAED